MQRVIQVLCLLMLMACHDRVICPAFQSTYILDDSTRHAFNSYVWQLDENTRNEFLGRTVAYDDDSLAVDDSLSNTTRSPKIDYYAYAEEKVVPWRVRGRNKYGIVKYEPYWLKKYRMRTAPMENVFAPKPPKEEELVAEEDSLSADSVLVASADSLTAQEVAAVTSDEEEVRFLYNYDPNDNFNVEQEYYNKHFGKRLIDNRPVESPNAVDSLRNEPDSVQNEPFFKRIFKNLFKKKETSTDTTFVDSPDLEPFEEEDEEELLDDSGNE